MSKDKVNREAFIEFVTNKRFRIHKARIIKKISLEDHDKLMDALSITFDKLIQKNKDIINARIKKSEEIKSKIQKLK